MALVEIPDKIQVILWLTILELKLWDFMGELDTGQ